VCGNSWRRGGLAELPTRTVTFLFMDLEGSTRLWGQHPETMKAALARHDELLRTAWRRMAVTRSKRLQWGACKLFVVHPIASVCGGGAASIQVVPRLEPHPRTGPYRAPSAARLVTPHGVLDVHAHLRVPHATGRDRGATVARRPGE
jgi:class 3 adenylate cyclase